MWHLAAHPRGEEVRGRPGGERHRGQNVCREITIQPRVGAQAGLTPQAGRIGDCLVDGGIADGGGHPAPRPKRDVDEVTGVGVVGEPVPIREVPGLARLPDPSEELVAANRELTHVEVDPDPAEIRPENPGLAGAIWEVARIEDGTASLRPRQRPRLRQVGTAERIDRGVLESGRPGGDELVGRSSPLENCVGS